jgi:uncharacterized protein with NAD-binding domain and iron-sulfur cluster
MSGAPHAAARSVGRTVAVFGGGVAGLTVAHELVERGYDVTVYEPVSVGGKARSIDVPGTGVDGRVDLPGEHGFRFFPGCYQHVPDTMRRIPFPGNAHGVADNLVRVLDGMFAFPDLPPVTVPTEPAGLGPLTPDLIRNTIMTTFALIPQLPPNELAFFAARLLMWFTMSPERRFGEYEYISYLNAVQAQGKSAAYQRYLVQAGTRVTVAGRPDLCSARSILSIGEALILAATELVPEYSGGTDRVLNGPTNQAWIDPWVAYLRSRGVRFVLGTGLTALRMRGGRIVGADTGGQTVVPDWYVCAMPADRTARSSTTRFSKQTHSWRVSGS